MSAEKAKQGPRAGATTLATVRPIAPADVPHVWELLRGLAEYEKLADAVTSDAGMLREALFGSGDRLRGLVAERPSTTSSPGRLVGYALFYPVFGSFRGRWRLWLEDLYVAPEARGSGAGVALMAELARLTLAGGYSALDWEVLDWNRPALDFYQRLGAERVATDLWHYRLDGDALEKAAGRFDGRR